jgi:alanine dehydrogenase
MPLLLNRDEVAALLPMRECIDAVEQAFAELARGTAVLPLRTNLAAPQGLSLYMPAYLPSREALACKVVTVYPQNPARHDLPTILATVLLQDPHTGEVVCIMEGAWLTALRTGAASGVATRHLARLDPGQRVGVFGAGVQARTQLAAVKEVRQLGGAVVYDVSLEAARGFAEEMGAALDLEVRWSRKPEEAAGCDIICTATTSATPLFDGRLLRPGTHINAVGSHTPGARELDSETVRRARLIGDSREACFRESGDLIIPLREGSIAESHFQAELGEVVIGSRPGRGSDEEITLFKSNGLAVQDAAAARLVYEKARAAGAGTQVAL